MVPFGWFGGRFLQLLLCLASCLHGEAFMCFSGTEFGWCMGDLCQNVTFSIAHFQLKLRSFILSNGRPPLKESYFIAKLPADFRLGMEEACPSALIAAYLVVAEVEAFTDPRVARGWFDVARQLYDGIPSRMGAEYLTGMLESGWPFREQTQRLEHALARADLALTQPPRTLDVVVAYCRGSLAWLTDGGLRFPSRERVRLFVYHKCGGRADIPNEEHYFGSVERIDRADGKVRGDECTAYLQYLTTQYGRYADHVIFLQDDALQHTLPSFTNIVLGAVAADQMELPFVHLNADRHVYTTTPCLKSVYRAVFGQDLTQLVGTYCCAQFLVSKTALESLGLHHYQYLMRLVESTQDLCFDSAPVRSSTCYILEMLWHAIWGEPLDLPLRADDPRLPAALRRKHGDERDRVDWRGLEFMPTSPRRVVAEDHEDLPSPARSAQTTDA